MPALGICCGSQLMNVYRGGSLIQFLPDESRPGALEHRKLGDEPTRHPVSVDLHSQLGEAIGKDNISVNTFHKQSVRTIGRGLRVVATAPDGVIEGFEDPSLPLFAAVQWHPERLHNEPEHLAPFKLLVGKARESGR
jgi:putative glutamine amidotransferase